MSTRSEIRFFKGDKQVGCVYHHHDGYPDHILCDLRLLRNEQIVKTMQQIAVNHGTLDPKCSHPTTPQGDLAYEYHVQLGDYRPKNVRVIKSQTGETVFAGSIENMAERFCKVW